MLLLDTNVLSALMSPERNTAVVNWLDRQSPEEIWITSITLLKGRFGLLLMPDGRRRTGLSLRFEHLVFHELEGRIAAFDRQAAEQAAIVSVIRRGSDRRTEYHDLQIAGIARARNASLATRNIQDFSGLGVTLINPWEA